MRWLGDLITSGDEQRLQDLHVEDLHIKSSNKNDSWKKRLIFKPGLNIVPLGNCGLFGIHNWNRAGFLGRKCGTNPQVYKHRSFLKWWHSPWRNFARLCVFSYVFFFGGGLWLLDCPISSYIPISINNYSKQKSTCGNGALCTVFLRQGLHTHGRDKALIKELCHMDPTWFFLPYFGILDSNVVK